MFKQSVFLSAESKFDDSLASHACIEGAMVQRLRADLHQIPCLQKQSSFFVSHASFEGAVMHRLEG